MVRSGPLVLAAAVLAAMVSATAVLCDATPVSPSDARAWVRWTIPLPKRIEIRGQMTVRPEQVVIPTVADGQAVYRVPEVQIYSVLVIPTR